MSPSNAGTKRRSGGGSTKSKSSSSGSNRSKSSSARSASSNGGAGSSRTKRGSTSSRSNGSSRSSGSGSSTRSRASSTSTRARSTQRKTTQRAAQQSSGAADTAKEKVGQAADTGKSVIKPVAGAMFAAAAGVVGGVVLDRTKLGRKKRVLGMPIPGTGKGLDGFARQVGEAGKQFGKLAQEVKEARERAEQVGKALS